MVVIGAGVVGAVLARSLAGRKLKVVMVERGCAAAETSGGNFGLVWVQSKSPAWYLRLTMASADSYPSFISGLAETGVDIEYRRDGALELILSTDGIETRQKNLEWQREIPGFRPNCCRREISMPWNRPSLPMASRRESGLPWMGT